VCWPIMPDRNGPWRQELTRQELASVICRFGAVVPHGLRGMRKELQAVDKNGNKMLERPELESALQACGINLSEFEIDQIFRHFDFNADGSVHYDEFLSGIRRPLCAQRALHVRKIFNTLDSNGNNVAYLADVASAFHAENTPQVLQGSATPDEVLESFLESLDSKKTSTNGLVTCAEFTDYYADVGNMMEDDSQFKQMLETCWGVSDSNLGATEVHPLSSAKALKPRQPEPLPEYVPMVRLPDHLDPSLSTMSQAAHELNLDKPTSPCLANTSGGAIYNLEPPVKRAPDLRTYHQADLRPDLLARFPERGGLDPGARISETKEQYTGKPFPPRVAQSTWKAEDTLADITKEYEELVAAPLMTTDPLEVGHYNYQSTTKSAYVHPSLGVEVGTAVIPPPRDRLRGGYHPKMDATFKSVDEYAAEKAK